MSDEIWKREEIESPQDIWAEIAAAELCQELQRFEENGSKRS